MANGLVGTASPLTDDKDSGNDNNEDADSVDDNIIDIDGKEATAMQTNFDNEDSNQQPATNSVRW